MFRETMVRQRWPASLQWISRERSGMRAMFEVQRGLCWLCDKPMIYPHVRQHDPRNATRDHLVPRSTGRTGLPNNKRLAHGSCNSLRSSVPAEYARAFVMVALSGKLLHKLWKKYFRRTRWDGSTT